MVCIQLVVVCVQLVVMCLQLVVVCVQLVVVYVQLVHKHTHTHTHTHAYIHTYIFTYICAYTYIYYNTHQLYRQCNRSDNAQLLVCVCEWVMNQLTPPGVRPTNLVLSPRLEPFTVAPII